MFLLEVLQVNPYLALSVSRGCLLSLTDGPFLIFKVISVASSNFLPALLPPFYDDSVDYIAPTQKSKIMSPSQNPSLDYIGKVSLPFKVTHSEVSELGHRHW